MRNEPMQLTSDEKTLIGIKLLHTAVWVFFNLVLIYLYYAVWTDSITWLFWAGICAFALEFVVLVFNGWNCPITFWARRYTDDDRDNFDIYLPNWLAKHTKTIYSTLVILLLLLFTYTQYFQ